MRLPNVERAEVHRGKLVSYLLSRVRPDGAGKAAFFERFGFIADDWEVLRDALLAHARHPGIAESSESGFGVRYTVYGPLPSPAGRAPWIRSVSSMDCGALAAAPGRSYPVST